MARKCKCQLCEAQLTTDTAYKRVVNGKNLYYCSETEYTNWQVASDREKAEKDRVYNALTAIFNYEIQNSALWREWQCWLKLKPNPVIAQYLEENKDYLASVMGRLDGNEYGRIRYLSKVLCNKLMDYKGKEIVQAKPKVIVEEAMYATPTRTPNRRRSLADLEDEV